jgi:hypothetical protein
MQQIEMADVREDVAAIISRPTGPIEGARNGNEAVADRLGGRRAWREVAGYVEAPARRWSRWKCAGVR